MDVTTVPGPGLVAPEGRVPAHQHRLDGLAAARMDDLVVQPGARTAATTFLRDAASSGPS